MKLSLLQHIAKITSDIPWPEGANYVALAMGSPNKSDGVLQFFHEKPESTWTKVQTSYKHSYTKYYWAKGGESTNHYAYVEYHEDANLRAFTKAELDAVHVEDLPTEVEAESNLNDSINSILLFVFSISLVLNLYLLFKG